MGRKRRMFAFDRRERPGGLGEEGIDVHVPPERRDDVDEALVGETMRHREILESELLMVRPMRFNGRVDVFGRDGRQRGDDGREPVERMARADAITSPDVAALKVGTLMAKVIAGRLETPRTLIAVSMVWGLLFLAIGFAIGWLVH